MPPPTLPGIEVLYKREQDPNASSPLTYREYVYFFPAASDEAMARAMLVAQFELVRSSLEPARPGKLVNMAMFDVSFKGRPPVPPMVTLTWKDWKGEPAIDFPRRKQNGPAATSAGVPSSPAAALAPVSVSGHPPTPSAQEHSTQPSAGVVVSAQAAPVPALVPAPAVPQNAQAGFPPPRVVPQDPVFPVIQPTQPVQVGAAMPVASAPIPTAAAPSPQVVALGTAQTVMQPATAAPVQQRRASKPNIRLRGDELIADLFEAMHDLHFLRDSVEGADFCLSLALEKIPSRVGIVHLYDIDKREFVVACVRGPNTEAALLQRYPEVDPILSAAMRRQRAIVWSDGGDANSLERYRIFGGARSLVVAPVMLAGRFLGALELMDPLDGSPFSDDEGHALSYIGEQFAEFVATRGVTVDPERIAGTARA